MTATGAARTIAIALLALVAMPAAAQHWVPMTAAQTVLERAAERYEALDGFCADFEQEIDVTLLRRVTHSHGEMCQARSDRFEMRFDEPAGDRIVADGTDLWVYFPSTDAGQVFRTRLAAAEGRYDLHREFLSNPDQRYIAVLEGREELNGRDMYVVELEPRAPSPYLNARVWIDSEEYLVRKVVVREESESVRTLHLSNIRLNPTISPERFEFQAPEGAQVIVR